ncbi:hypothetical protein [Desulfosporosinus acididurans]|nr:hypothetical protein [Desulfosporosinus acididurans]
MSTRSIGAQQGKEAMTVRGKNLEGCICESIPYVRIVWSRMR